MTERIMVLIWIQSVWHYDSIPERFFLKKLLLKKVSKRQQEHEKLLSMQSKSSGQNKTYNIELCMLGNFEYADFTPEAILRS